MTIDEQIEVMQASKRDGVVQFRSAEQETEWKDTRSPAWNFSETEYRPKPPPKVFWANEYSDATVFHESPGLALKKATLDCIRAAVKYIEAEDQT